MQENEEGWSVVYALSGRLDMRCDMPEPTVSIPNTLVGSTWTCSTAPEPLDGLEHNPERVGERLPLRGDARFGDEGYPLR